MAKRLFWGVRDFRSGWMIDRGGTIRHVMGPSICTSSGGGPVRAVEEVLDWDWSTDVVEIPDHTPMPGRPCECHDHLAKASIEG